MKPAPAIHWLRHNAAIRSPYRVLVLDTETAPVVAGNPDEQRLRLWSAQLTRRHDVDPKEPRSSMIRGTTARELATSVNQLAKRDRTLWVFAHNLSFDLAVTALPVELVALGWRMTEGALTTESPWCRMVRGGSRITIADSWSWLPTSVAALGELVGLEKLPLPAWEDDDAAWWARCDRDVEVTSAAILQVMDWWDRGELGNWSVTGPSCGWSTYRHFQPNPHVLIDPGDGAREFEARAITGGRRQVSRLGPQLPGLYVDLDMATAHLAVMQGQPLPWRRMAHFDSLAPDSRMLNGRVVDVIAECVVDLAAPRFAWDSGGGIFYPVGRFTTVLTGPEIREARDRGELVSIGEGWTYGLSGHMAPWAAWLRELIDNPPEGTPAVVRLAAKNWSRCVPGKWAGHTSETITRTPDPRPGWNVVHGYDPVHGGPVDLLRFGGELLTIARDRWSDDAFPAVLAFIQGHVRVALGRLLDALGPAWLATNTDGALVDARAMHLGRGDPDDTVRVTDRDRLDILDRWCAAYSLPPALFTVRPKGKWSDAIIYGPQHLILGGERHMSGVPGSATRDDDGRYVFTAWPKLRVQIGTEGPAGYTTQRRRVQVDNIPPAGWLACTGRVFPARIGTVDGRDALLPPSDALMADSGPLQPPERQHPKLRKVLAAALTDDGPTDWMRQHLDDFQAMRADARTLRQAVKTRGPV